MRGSVGVEDQVVEPVVAVHDRDLRVVARARRDVRRQPLDQAVHRLDRLGDRGQVLLGPAADLALEVVARLAVVGQADAAPTSTRVQRGDHAVHLVVDRARGRPVERRAATGPTARGRRRTPSRRRRGRSPLSSSHSSVHLRHRHAGAGQRAHHRELALDRVRRRQQLGRRAGLGAHHVGARRRDQLVGRVRLAALELLDRAAARRSPAGARSR